MSSILNSTRMLFPKSDFLQLSLVEPLFLTKAGERFLVSCLMLPKEPVSEGSEGHRGRRVTWWFDLLPLQDLLVWN